MVWDPESGQEVGPRIELDGGSAIGVAWTPDGEQLAVVADNNLVHLYDADGDHAELGEPIESIDAPYPRGGLLAGRHPVGYRELGRGRPAVVGRHP